jgi:hypothetical protein
MSWNRAMEWSEIIGWSRPPEGFSEPEQLLSFLPLRTLAFQSLTPS